MDQAIYHSSKNNLKILKEKLAVNRNLLSSVLCRSPTNATTAPTATISQSELANSSTSKSDVTTKQQEDTVAEKVKLKREQTPIPTTIPFTLTSADLDDREVTKKAKKFRRDNELKLLLNEFDVLKEPELTSFYDDSAEFDFFDDDLLIKEEKESGPKNNYCQHFVDTGQRPQNFIRDPGLSDRFEEYPKLRELIKMKDELIVKTNVPARPMYIKSSLLAEPGADSFPLQKLIGSDFDVILVEPPLHEYQMTNNVTFSKYYTWDEIKAIDVASVAGQRAFVFLWCGSSDGLDKGRECMRKWGFRRCEDICWIKTNKNKAIVSNKRVMTTGIFQATKEHCLMGIKGTVRRSTDAAFIHTNIDIDLIISEEPEDGSPKKPNEIFNIIEHFCLGKRRLYLFGREDSIRPGWLTVGPALSDTYFDRELFRSSFETGSGILTGTSDRIEILRPRTPPMKQKMNQQYHGSYSNNNNSISNLFNNSSNNNNNNNNDFSAINDQGDQSFDNSKPVFTLDN